MKMDNEINSSEDRIMYLQQRKKALTILLHEKNELLRRLCLQEAEITGIIPSEMPEEVSDNLQDSNYANDSNINLTLRRKVETGFKLSETLLSSSVSNEDDDVRKLLLEKQVQMSIAEAALNMANNLSNNKAVRRKHRHMYKQSQEKLAGINETLNKRMSQISNSNMIDNNIQYNVSNISREESFNHNVGTSPISHNNVQNASNRYSECVSDNYYLYHSDQNLGSVRDMHKYIHYDLNESQSPCSQDNTAHNYYVNKQNVHTQNKYRKKPRPPADDFTVKKEQSTLIKHNINKQSGGYADQQQTLLPDYRNTIASDTFFTHPRKDYYQTNYDESPSHNSEFFYDISTTPKTMLHHKNKQSYHQSERNLFGSLDRRKINISPMLNENIRSNQKIKNSNRSHSIGELKMAEDVTDNISVGSHNSGNTLKEKQWHETLLDEQPISPTKQRAKTITHPYDIPVNQNYIEHSFKSLLENKYNYDYVDAQYLQPSLPNHNYETLFENNVPHTGPLTRPLIKQTPLTVSQNQTIIAKPAMPSPTYSNQYNNDVLPKSPSQDNSFNHHAFSKSVITNETKPFLSSKTVPVESPKNIEVVSPGTWCPYKEVSKPFEMSDFYKYSVKFRNRQAISSENNNKVLPFSAPTKEKSELRAQYSDVESNTDTVQKGVYQPLRPLKCQPIIQNHNIETE